MIITTCKNQATGKLENRIIGSVEEFIIWIMVAMSAAMAIGILIGKSI